MGETREDRCDLAFELKAIGANVVPVNILNPIPGTPFAKNDPLPVLEILKTIACFRFILPRQEIMVAGGRTVNLRDAQSMIFLAGASALMVGNYLTTLNQSVEKDLQMLKDLGLNPRWDNHGFSSRKPPRRRAQPDNSRWPRYAGVVALSCMPPAASKKADTITDDTGAYDFGDLAPGEYFLAVTAQPWYALHNSALRQRPIADPSTALDVAYPVTFFDSTTDDASTTPINLAAGSREEANINLHAVPALHLTAESPMKQNWVTARAQLRQVIFGSLASTDTITPPPATQTDTAEFTGVAPGHYELSQGDPPRIADLDATSNQQLDANLGKPAVELSGTLRSSYGTSLPDKVTLNIESLEGVHRQEQIFVNSDGQFSFQSIRQGNYELTASTPDKQLPIISITIGNHSHPGNQITVSDKPMLAMVTVSLGETRIEGFARKAEKGLPGVMVVLVPKEPAAFPALTRRDQSDSDGSFALRDVAPGKYTVVAIEDGWELDWARPEVIGRYLSGGIPVNVTESSGKLVRLSEAVPVQSR